MPGDGRTMQKERTRQALLTATRALFQDGEIPSIATVATKANVSEPTAYRYYNDVRSLLQDALADHWPKLDDVLLQIRSKPLAEDRAQYAAEQMTRIVLANEAQIRSLIALTYAPANRNALRKGSAVRPAYRFLLIDAVLEPLLQSTPASDVVLLRNSLAAVIGAEAIFSLKDALQLKDADVGSVLGWSARCLTLAALKQ